MCDENWKNWTEINAYDIDEENGIAYYSHESMAKAWGDLSTAAHLFARAGSDMTILSDFFDCISRLVTDPDGPDKPDLHLLGDVNLDDAITVADVVLLQKYLLGETTLTKDAYSCADVDMDETVNGFDFNRTASDVSGKCVIISLYIDNKKALCRSMVPFRFVSYGS